MQTEKPIYLDYNATTPLDPRVLESMLPYLENQFGNPASATHFWGWQAKHAVQKARSQVAQLINAQPQEISFTAGSTESNNWVLFGLVHKYLMNNPTEPIHIITSKVEHSSILSPLRALERLGVEVTYLDINKFGQVEVAEIKKHLRPSTKLLSFIWVNNEIGSINPIAEIAKLAKEQKIYFHSDATQAVGKIPVDVEACGVDLISFSSHKIYGPKGTGALYLRSRNPKVQIEPLIYGGGQERGLRSGTVNVANVVGFGMACEISAKVLQEEAPQLQEKRDYLWQGVQKIWPDARLNGHPVERSPMNLNFSVPSISVELLLPKLQKIGFSSGAACGSGSMTSSHVLAALGLSPQEINGSFRLGVGRNTTREELDFALKILKSTKIR